MKFKDNKQWRFFADRNIVSQTIDVYWMAQGIDGKSYKRDYGDPELTTAPEGITSVSAPTFRMDYDEAQTLLQELWNTGMRPEGVEGTVAHVDALKAHIKSQSDMLQHFMMMQVQADPDTHAEIYKIKQALSDLNPGLSWD